jgi:hypothetical protein
VAGGTGEQHEDRTRVVCHLPLNSVAEEKAFKEVIAYLESQRKLRIGVDGYTYSDPKAFFGRWWSSKQGGWMEDRIVLLIVDYHIDLSDQRVSLAEKVAELKQILHDAYRRYHRPQDEMWVVGHRVTRYA